MKTVLKVSLLVLVLFAIVALAPRVTNAAAPALCGANPSTAVVGTKITITCSGFDRDALVNVYVVEPTGFTEIGKDNYAACMEGTRVSNTGRATSKVDENGIATFLWYTQNGVNSCPTSDYNGYANQIGTYTVVVQQLDGVGGIKYKGQVDITLNGRTDTYSGATLIYPASVTVFSKFVLGGTGFKAYEYVSVWFTRPANCSGQGEDYWTGNSAFSPKSWGENNGVVGPETVKADASGSFVATYDVYDSNDNDLTPCLGTWFVTARALGSGIGQAGSFVLNGLTVANNASVWTTESAVPSIGQTVYGEYGVAVHVYGSGFPASSNVNCWFTRPDGTVYPALNPDFKDTSTAAKVDGAGNFNAGVTFTYTSERAVQGEQPGQWAITCGTPDGKYSGTAWFWVVPLIDP